MASTEVGKVYYTVGLNDGEFNSSIKTASKNFSNLGDSLNNIGTKMKSIGTKMSLLVTAPLLLGLKSAITAASDLNETINKVDVAFSDQSDAVKEWSKTSIKSFGMAQGTALDMASTYGDMSTSMGLTTEEAYSMSTSLVGLAGDMASFKNISVDRAQTALTGVYTGETEALKTLGIVMTDTNVKNFAIANGMKDSWEEISQAEKVTWRYKYVMDVTKNAQGDFARTSDSVANQSRTASEKVKELSTNLGQNLLPIYSKILTVVNNLIDKFNGLNEKQQNMILIVGGILLVMGPLLIMLGSILTMAPAIAAAFTAMTGPVGLSIMAFVAAMSLGIALGKALVDNWYKIEASAKNIFSSISDSISSSFKTAFNYVAKAWNNTVGKIGFTVPNWIPSIGGKSWSIPDIPMFARGVSNFGGGMALVGEEGPELVSLPSGSSVTPNDKLGSNITINLSGIMASSKSDLRIVAKDLVSALNEELRAKGVAQIGV